MDGVCNCMYEYFDVKRDDFTVSVVLDDDGNMMYLDELNNMVKDIPKISFVSEEAQKEYDKLCDDVDDLIVDWFEDMDLEQSVSTGNGLVITKTYVRE